jgi:LuxR family maltose regulon positive regulatory protein
VTTAILATKLYIPPLPSNLVPRPRLIEKLNQGLKDKLILISAPAGFGKTTLLSECVNKCGIPVAWLSLDVSDNHLARFLTYLIAAIQTIEPNLGESASTNLQSPQPPIDAVLTSLINEIAANARDDLVLVIDDYHNIESQEIDQAVTYFLEHMPLRMHLVISGRTDPSLPLPRLRSRGQMTEIRVDDLRFTPEEVVSFLEQGMGLDISSTNVAALETRTEGWIAGLQMAALSMQGLERPEDITQFVHKFSGSHRFIMDYLTDEVLQQRPEGTRDFLLQTSILKRLSAPLCQAVTGMENSQAILETLEGVNLFLIPLDDERLWYRYHHLFDDLLQKRLKLLQPEIVPTLNHRAADWYRKNGWTTEALDHLLAAGDFPGAAELVEQNAKALLERSELTTLMNWVGALPETNVRDRPWLCVYHAWALRLSGAPFVAVQSQLEAAQAGISKEQRRSRHQFEKLQGHILALQAFQHLYMEDIPTVLELTQSAQGYDIEENFVLASIAFARGWALRFSGDLDAAFQAFADTKKYSLASANIFMAVAATCRAAYGRVLGGQLRQAYEDLQGAINLATIEDGKQYFVAGYAYVYLGGILYEWNDLADAKRYLLEGVEYCSMVGYIMDQVVGLVTLAQIYLVWGDWDAIQDVISDAINLRDRMKSYVYVRRWVENIQVRLWRAQGAWDQLIGWIQSCGMTIHDDLAYNRDLEHVILARALLYAGGQQPESSYLKDAQALLSRLLEKAEAANWGGKVIEILVLQALVFQARGENQSALTHLMKAITRAEPEGYVRIFVDEGPPLQALLHHSSPQVTATAYVKKLMAAFEPQEILDQHRSTVQGPSPPLLEPLSSRELEVLHLLAEGMTNQEIALELIIALTTAKKHVSNIIGKLGVTNRTQAVARARELNLI